MNKQPFVNIIILNWNNYEDTVECIDSLGEIDYRKWGVTLIDNGSRDGSGQKLASLYKKNKKIKMIFNKRNFGFGKGNNIGMRKDLFNTDYFLLLNNDVIVAKGFLKNLIKEGKDLISPLIYDYDSRKLIKEVIMKENSPGEFNFILGGGRRVEFNEEEIIKVDYASGCCWLIKKELFLKTGGFDEEYFLYNEEIEWAYRLKQQGYKFYVSPISIIWHKGSSTANKVPGLKLKYMNRNMIWFERKYASKRDFLLFKIYLFIYKIPKNIVLIILYGEKKMNRIRCLTEGIKEGFLEPSSKNNKVSEEKHG